MANRNIWGFSFWNLGRNKQLNDAHISQPPLPSLNTEFHDDLGIVIAFSIQDQRLSWFYFLNQVEKF